MTGAIVINGSGGDDTLTIDLSGGPISRPITFNGGGQATAAGDKMVVTGGSAVASVTHSFTNANDGTIQVAGSALITYTGLEPITDNLSATDRIFTFKRRGRDDHPDR